MGDRLVIPRRRFIEVGSPNQARDSHGRWTAGGDVASKAVSHARSHGGGATISMSGLVPHSGYAVAGVTNAAGEKNERVFKGNITPDMLRQYITDNVDELRKPNRFIGIWAPDDSDVTMLDTPEVHNDRATALALAHDRDEIAIYNLNDNVPDNEREVHTMSDKLRPSESSGTRIRESDSTKRTTSKGAPIALLDPRKLTVDQMVDHGMRALRDAGRAV